MMKEFINKENDYEEDSDEEYLSNLESSYNNDDTVQEDDVFESVYDLLFDDDNKRESKSGNLLNRSLLSSDYLDDIMLKND